MRRAQGRRAAPALDGKLWSEKTAEERQRVPGDYEAQDGQGPISLHSEEHLATSDRGIVMQRRMLERQMKVVAEGGDPIGVIFDPRKEMVHVRSGNFFQRPGPYRLISMANSGGGGSMSTSTLIRAGRPLLKAASMAGPSWAISVTWAPPQPKPWATSS